MWRYREGRRSLDLVAWWGELQPFKTAQKTMQRCGDQMWHQMEKAGHRVVSTWKLKAYK